jgi:hypothetical protein
MTYRLDFGDDLWLQLLWINESQNQECTKTNNGLYGFAGCEQMKDLAISSSE